MNEESLSPDDIAPSNLSSDKVLLEMECEFIKPMNAIRGTMQITATHIYFNSSEITPITTNNNNNNNSNNNSSNNRGVFLRKQWPLDEVVKVYSRR